MQILVFIKNLALCLLVGFSSPTFAEPLKVGDLAPGFQLLDQHSEPISLKQYRGQWVVLYFYPKNNTPGCTKEACSFRDSINNLIRQQAVILGASVDSIESHKSFAKKFDLPFSLLADEKGRVAQSYGALLNLGFIKFAKRHSFIIDPSGKVAKIYRDVDPDNHVQQVLGDLNYLQKGL